MGLHGVTEAVDALQSGVAGGVIADGVGGTGDIIVDGTGDTDDRDAALSQSQQTTEGTVAADTHQGIQAQELTGGQGLLAAGRLLELQAAGGVQNGTAPTGDIADAFKIQTGKIAVDKAVIATTNADTLNSHVQGRSDNGADGGIHAGSVSTAGKYADTMHCCIHVHSSQNMKLMREIKP